MSSRNIFAPLRRARIIVIPFIIGTALMIGGFVPHHPQQSANDHAHSDAQGISYPDFVQTYASVTSHNLVIDKEELHCLAQNIYFEARSEPLEGKLAVAGVTMNRVANDHFPNTICDVVQHSYSNQRHHCQFSWWCDGKKDETNELVSWREAQQLARLYLANIYQDPTYGALWYHAEYVQPFWSEKLHRTTQIGKHIFYSEEDLRTAQLAQ